MRDVDYKCEGLLEGEDGDVAHPLDLVEDTGDVPDHRPMGTLGRLVAQEELVLLVNGGELPRPRPFGSCAAG